MFVWHGNYTDSMIMRHYRSTLNRLCNFDNLNDEKSLFKFNSLPYNIEHAFNFRDIYEMN